MTTAQDFRVVNFSGFKLHGDHILAAFVVELSALKWSKAQADAFAEAFHERHPDLFAFDYHYEQIPDEADMLRPTTAERIRIAWRREITGPEQREDVDREFAARRQAVMSLLVDHLGKLNDE